MPDKRSHDQSNAEAATSSKPSKISKLDDSSDPGASHGQADDAAPPAVPIIPPAIVAKPSLTTLPIEVSTKSCIAEAAGASDPLSVLLHLLYFIMILAANAELALVNHEMHRALQNAPTSVRAAYIISIMWQQLGDEIISLLNGLAFQDAFDEMCGQSTVIPTRLADPRDLVNRKDLSLIDWTKSKRSAISGRGQRSWRFSRGTLVQVPLDFALRFGMCSRIAVVDAFADMLARIPTFAKIAEEATVNGRMRAHDIPATLLHRLQVSCHSKIPVASVESESARVDEPRPSRLYALVSVRGEVGPAPDEAALTLFLRVVFWHFASNVELFCPNIVLPSDSTDETETAATDPKEHTQRFHFLRTPVWPSFYLKHSIETALLETEAFQLCSRQGKNTNLWVLRLLLHFGSREWDRDESEDFDCYESAVSQMIESGWIDGLDLVFSKKAPHDTIIESSVCNSIARVLWEDGFLDGKSRLPASTHASASLAASDLKVRWFLQSREDYYDALEDVFNNATETLPSVPPLPIIYARATLPPDDNLLNIAVRKGRFDVYSHLKQRYGLQPDDDDLVTLAEAKVEEALAMSSTPPQAGSKSRQGVKSRLQI
ncbi:hypothetical protein V8E36_009011 [Tilletia maclaganii]